MAGHCSYYLRKKGRAGGNSASKGGFHFGLRFPWTRVWPESFLGIEIPRWVFGMESAPHTPLTLTPTRYRIFKCGLRSKECGEVAEQKAHAKLFYRRPNWTFLAIFFSHWQVGSILLNFIPLGSDSWVGLRTIFGPEFILSYLAWFLMSHALPGSSEILVQADGLLDLPSFSHSFTSLKVMEPLPCCW